MYAIIRITTFLWHRVNMTMQTYKMYMDKTLQFRRVCAYVNHLNIKTKSSTDRDCWNDNDITKDKGSRNAKYVHRCKSLLRNTSVLFLYLACYNEEAAFV